MHFVLNPFSEKLPDYKILYFKIKESSRKIPQHRIQYHVSLAIILLQIKETEGLHLVKR